MSLKTIFIWGLILWTSLNIMAVFYAFIDIASEIPDEVIENGTLVELLVYVFVFAILIQFMLLLFAWIIVGLKFKDKGDS